MDYIIVKSFSDTGRPLPSVALPLGKSETAIRIMRRIAKLAKGGEPDMDGNTLADLDSGRIRFSTLAKLFQRSELERAVKIRLADVNLGPDEREQLLSLLKIDKNAWSASMGGERAYDRFGVRRYEGHDPEGKASIRKSRERETLQKSVAHAAVLDTAKANGWRPHHDGPDGGLVMIHPKKNGHELSVSGSGEWSHTYKRGTHGKTLGSGGPSKIAAHLAAFSKDHED